MNMKQAVGVYAIFFSFALGINWYGKRVLKKAIKVKHFTEQWSEMAERLVRLELAFNAEIFPDKKIEIAENLLELGQVMMSVMKEADEDGILKAGTYEAQEILFNELHDKYVSAISQLKGNESPIPDWDGNDFSIDDFPKQ